MNHVSEQEILKIGDTSQRKLSMMLESQNSRFKPRLSVGGGGGYDKQPSGPAAEDKPSADSAAHDGDIMQWFADDDVAVIGHDDQKKQISCSKKDDKK